MIEVGGDKEAPPLRELLDELGLRDYMAASAPGRPLTAPGREVFALLREAARPQAPRLLLKQRQAYLSDAEFRLHVELHRHLFRAAAPVVPLPPGFAEKLPLEAADGRLFELQVWVGGRTPRADSPADLKLLGGALAEFHAAAASFPWRGGAEVHGEPRQRFAKADFYRRRLRDALGASADALEAPLYELLGRARARLEAAYAEFGPEPLQPVHGDPDTHNGLILDGRCLLFDYDDAHLSTRAADLAWLLTLCAGLRQLDERVPYTFRDRWSEEGLRAILDAYLRAAPLEPSGRAALRWWMVAATVCATVDCFFHGECLVELSRLRDECARAIGLIHELEHIELCQ